MNFKINKLQPDPVSWDSALFLPKKYPSAVAIVVFDAKSTDPKVLMIRRSKKSSSHRGQIGFPGGRFEHGDHNPQGTALRESQEEVGIDVQSMTILGAGQTLKSIDGSFVVPIFAVTDFDPLNLVKNNAEVDEIHLISLKSILRDNTQEFKFNLFGCWRHSFLYDCGAISIWGLSAEVLANADFRAN